MPPKSSPTPKSGKGKKLTKAEKEKLKKEEEDHKKQEEEEAKIRAEQEEEEKKEREKQEAEERRKLENEERKRRKGQLQELEDIIESNTNTYLSAQAERRKNSKWERYMRCDGSPDPTVSREINTYMNLWREDVDHKDMDYILKESKGILSLINELTFLQEDTPADEITEDEIAKYKVTMLELEELVQSKLDLASHDLLLKATALADAETMNLQTTISDGVITVCMWGNLSKNPRVKTYEFSDKGFTFEIPKVLSLSDCAVRVMFTEYDHFSPHCRTYQPRHKKIEEPKEEEKPEGEEDGEKKEGEEGEEGAEGAEEKKEDKKEEEKEEEPEEDVMKELEGLKEEEVDEEKQEEENKDKVEEPMEEDYEIKTPGDVPLVNTDDTPKQEPIDWEDFDGDEDVIDLRAYQVMGPVFHFNLLNLPPQPKQVRDWCMTLLEDNQLTSMDYMVDLHTGGTPASAQSSREKDSEDGEKKEKKEERPPIGVHLRLPRDVYFCEEPQVARWDYVNKQWQLDGFTDHSFDEDNKILSFKTAHFGVMSLIQDSHINMPFQSWELRPRGSNHALLTIIAAIIEVEMEIKDDKCCLIVPEDRPELNHFIDKWIPTLDMIKKLKAAGLNVFPAIDSHKYVSVQNKNCVTEDRLYQQMALTASTMAYSWSKWNTEVKAEDKIVVQACEHLEDEPLLEEDWGLYLVTKKRTTKLKMTEFDETFSDDHAEGTEFHADLYHMTVEIATPEGKERLSNNNHKFYHSVYTLLKQTRLLTYS